MFEIQGKKSGRVSIASKNNSTSRSKLGKKEVIGPKQRIVLDLIKTDGNFKQKKSKSQCFSNERKNQRKSIDTTRSTGTKKSREKTEKIVKTFQQIHTQDRVRHQSFIISNLTTEKSAELKWTKKNSLKKVSEGRSTQKKKAIWNEKLIPYDWQYVVQHYGHYLTKYQHSQIKQYKKIYFIGHKALKRQKIDSNNPSFDNQEYILLQHRKEYKYTENDHIAFRYEILSIIGKGSYGQVFKAFDHKNKEEIALKIIKNQQKFSKQAFIQIKILSHIKQVDEQQQSNIVRIKDFVIFRKHACIIFEILSDNLYELIIRNNYNGLNQQLIRRFAIQILVSLEFLRNNKIIHCDLKPQNILLKQYNKSGIKIIDFGSSCFEKETLYTYIQSRYYRAPEITVGIPYSHYIDIWSIGCILAELYTGVPVFPGENQYEQMKYMTDTLGMPSRSFIAKGSRKGVFFDEHFNVKPQIKFLQSTLEMFSKPLKARIQNEDFLSFIQSFLKWDPQERITPVQALSHNWIRKGLPQQLKNKLSASNHLLKNAGFIKDNPSKRVKTKSKQKGSSLMKNSSKPSQERLKKASFCLKF